MKLTLKHTPRCLFRFWVINAKTIEVMHCSKEATEVWSPLQVQINATDYLRLGVPEFEAWKCTILVIYRLLDFPKSPSLLDTSTSRSSASQEHASTTGLSQTQRQYCTDSNLPTRDISSVFCEQCKSESLRYLFPGTWRRTVMTHALFLL